MKKTLATLLMSLLAVYALPGYAAAATPAPRPAPDRQFQPQRSPATVKNGVETLTGEAAVEHLAALKERQKKLFAQADQKMRGRGYETTDVVIVHRSVAGNQRTQESAADENGELVWVSWDDGVAETWEGTLYYENYSTGITTVFNSQILLGELDTVWEERVGSYGGGGGDKEQMTGLRPGAKHEPVAQLASGDASAAGLRSGIVTVQTGPQVHGFLRCANRGCSAALAMCAGAGPFGVACFAAFCGATLLGCAAYYLM